MLIDFDQFDCHQVESRSQWKESETCHKDCDWEVWRERLPSPLSMRGCLVSSLNERFFHLLSMRDSLIRSHVSCHSLRNQNIRPSDLILRSLTWFAIEFLYKSCRKKRKYSVKNLKNQLSLREWRKKWGFKQDQQLKQRWDFILIHLSLYLIDTLERSATKRTCGQWWKWSGWRTTYYRCTQERWFDGGWSQSDPWTRRWDLVFFCWLTNSRNSQSPDLSKPKKMVFRKPEKASQGNKSDLIVSSTKRAAEEERADQLMKKHASCRESQTGKKPNLLSFGDEEEEED